MAFSIQWENEFAFFNHPNITCFKEEGIFLFVFSDHSTLSLKFNNLDNFPKCCPRVEWLDLVTTSSISSQLLVNRLDFFQEKNWNEWVNVKDYIANLFSFLEIYKMSEEKFSPFDEEIICEFNKLIDLASFPILKHVDMLESQKKHRYLSTITKEEESLSSAVGSSVRKDPLLETIMMGGVSGDGTGGGFVSGTGYGSSADHRLIHRPTTGDEFKPMEIKLHSQIKNILSQLEAEEFLKVCEEIFLNIFFTESSIPSFRDRYMYADYYSLIEKLFNHSFGKEFKERSMQDVVEESKGGDGAEDHVVYYDSAKFTDFRVLAYKKDLIPSAIKSVMAELKDLNYNLKGLPIYVAFDECDISFCEFLIIPSISPYKFGCFRFICQFPSDYPSKPPHVQILTTGGGRFRFNPNLYADGKVCLSLLGTWPGSAEEMWNPKLSTLFQILMSIFTLIFVEDPMFNEPGEERMIGTTRGKSRSALYNGSILKGTMLYAIHDHLTTLHPSPFKSIIRNHFKTNLSTVLDEYSPVLKELPSNVAAELIKIQGNI